jgi:uncharacterized protein
VKYLILIGVVFAVIWWIKSSRPDPKTDRQKGSSTDAPQQMVVCAHCGVHLPEQDAVFSANASYCSQAHRSLKEG